MKLLLLFLFPIICNAEPAHTDYERVAASQTDQVIGPVGGAGDVLERIIIIPLANNCGGVSFKDGSGSSIVLMQQGNPNDLDPHSIELGMRSVNGAFKITTGANVNVIAIGRFK